MLQRLAHDWTRKVSSDWAVSTLSGTVGPAQVRRFKIFFSEPGPKTPASHPIPSYPILFLPEVRLRRSHSAALKQGGNTFTETLVALAIMIRIRIGLIVEPKVKWPVVFGLSLACLREHGEYGLPSRVSTSCTDNGVTARCHLRDRNQQCSVSTMPEPARVDNSL